MATTPYNPDAHAPLAPGSVVRLVRIWECALPSAQQTVARVDALTVAGVRVLFTDPMTSVGVGFDYWPYDDIEVLS